MPAIGVAAPARAPPLLPLVRTLSPQPTVCAAMPPRVPSFHRLRAIPPPPVHPLFLPLASSFALLPCPRPRALHVLQAAPPHRIARLWQGTATLWQHRFRRSCVSEVQHCSLFFILAPPCRTSGFRLIAPPPRAAPRHRRRSQPRPQRRLHAQKRCKCYRVTACEGRRAHAKHRPQHIQR